MNVVASLRVVLLGLLLVGSFFVVSLPAVADPPTSQDDILTRAYPDGPLKEASMQQHLLVLGRALDQLEAASHNSSARQTVSPEVRTRVEKMLDYLLYSTLPNGQLPRWGESTPPTEGLRLLLRGADLFRREDMRWVATRGKKGKRPIQTSAAFPNAGYYLLRSGWEPLACFLAVHNGDSVGQGHADANSFVLTGFGNELLIDPGSALSDSAQAKLLARSEDHNTVTMDDQDTAQAAGKVQFQPGALMDVYDGTNAGYAGQDKDPSARHRRRIVFIKLLTFLVIDDTRADHPHDWTLNFHFAPGEVSYRPDTQQLVFDTTANTLSGIEQPANSNATASTALPGGLALWSQDDHKPTMDTAPIALGVNRLLPTPRARWTVTQAKTAHFATLLMPFGEAEVLDQWIVKEDQNGATVAYGPLDSPFSDVLIVAPDGGPPPDVKSSLSTGIDTDAQVAFLRSGPRDPDAFDADTARIPYALAVTHATRLSWQGDPHPLSNRPAQTASQTLFTASQPVSHLEAIWVKDTLLVNVTGGQGVQIRPFAARRLVVNGRPQTIAPSETGFVAIMP
jgi:hypothetical protein